MSVRPIRVLCIVPRGLAGRGGIETLFSHVDEDLRSRPEAGLEMEFLASRGDASGPGWVFHFPLSFVRYVWLLATRRFDIVHLNAATNASAWRKWMMQEVARLAGVATVIHFHGSAFPKPGASHPRWVSVLRRVFDNADAIIVLGKYWRDFVSTFYDMPSERFVVVPNGVADFAPDAPLSREKNVPVRLLFAGNLTDAKGAGVLLKALGRLPEQIPSWRAVFAGSGDINAFQERAQHMGLTKQVEFTGWVTRDAILPLYIAADIVVLPSRNEVLPVCLLEGACAGAALIATPVGSVPDVLQDGENGLTIMADDPEGLSNALAEMICDDTRRETFRANSRARYVSRFQLASMIEALRGAYETALTRHRKGA